MSSISPEFVQVSAEQILRETEMDEDGRPAKVYFARITGVFGENPSAQLQGWGAIGENGKPWALFLDAERIEGGARIPKVQIDDAGITVERAVVGFDQLPPGLVWSNAGHG